MNAWKQQVEHLIDAIEHAEGGHDALIRAVQCSFPQVTDYSAARLIAYGSILHALWDWAMRTPDEFIYFFGDRWAPIGAANDPHNLNANWVKNVEEAFNGSTGNDAHKADAAAQGHDNQAPERSDAHAEDQPANESQVDS